MYLSYHHITEGKISNLTNVKGVFNLFAYNSFCATHSMFETSPIWHRVTNLLTQKGEVVLESLGLQKLCGMDVCVVPVERVLVAGATERNNEWVYQSTCHYCSLVLL